MIVREIADNPELIDDFDWFNDYRDTLQWARHACPEAVLLLKYGYERYLRSRRMESPDERKDGKIVVGWHLPTLNDAIKDMANFNRNRLEAGLSTLDPKRALEIISLYDPVTGEYLSPEEREKKISDKPTTDTVEE